MYYTGLGPITKQPVQVAKGLRDRKAQRALVQFFKPENYFAVREALLGAGRAELRLRRADRGPVRNYLAAGPHQPAFACQSAVATGNRPRAV